MSASCVVESELPMRATLLRTPTCQSFMTSKIQRSERFFSRLAKSLDEPIDFARFLEPIGQTVFGPSVR